MNFNHDVGLTEGLLIIDTTEAPPLGGLVNTLSIIGTGSIIIPSGTVLQRPTGQAGMFRFNSDISTLEFFDGSIWRNGGGSVTSVSIASDSTTNSALSVVSGSPVTTSGTIHLSLGSELVGLAGLSSTGLVVRTGAGTYTEASITGTAGNITISNGNGVLGNPTINLATVTQGVTGTSFVKVRLDTFGRVIDNTGVIQADLTGLLGTYYLPTTGGTMTGSIVMSGYDITGLPTIPSGPSSAASKAYVDASTSALNIHQAVEAATVQDLSATGDTNNSNNGAVTYTPGTADLDSGFGIGATLTSTNLLPLKIDGYTLQLNTRVLIKNQTNQQENGVYYVSTLGVIASTAWVLTRATDYNNSIEGQVIAGDFTWVSEGITQNSTGWVEIGVGTVSPNDVINIGTDAIIYTQFSGAGTYLGTANQIDLIGNIFSLSSTMVAPGSVTVTGALTATSGTINGTSIGATTPSTGKFTTFEAIGTVTLDPANLNVNLTPTGTGTVIINPATLGSIDNMSIGATIADTGRFTTVESTVTTGTAPFIVASTTPVANLSIGGNAATSTVSANSTVTAVGVNATYYPTFVSATSGDLPIDVDGGLTYNPSTNNLSTTTFTGDLIGNASTATNATNSANAGITLTSANATYYPTFVSGTSGNLPIDAGSGLTFNPSTNTLSTTTFNGALVGNASSATAASTITITSVGINATYYPTFVDATTGNLAAGVDIGLTYNPSTNTLSTTALNLSGQLTSTLSTGTAPFVLASTTQVANLNVSYLEGNTWEVPGTIGSTTPNSAVFTTLQANSTVTLNPANANISLQPTGTGTVTINPATTGTIDNMIIGGTTPAAGNFTTITTTEPLYISNGTFTTGGIATMGMYVLRNVTTNNTPTELFLNGELASSRVILKNNSVYTFNILISGRRYDATGGGAGYEIRGVMRKDSTSSSITMIGAISKTILGETNSSWDATVTADTTNGSIKIVVTGENAKTIHWLAAMTTGEVTN